MSAANWLRFWKGITAYDRLAGLPLTVPAWYLPLWGAAWGTVGLVAALGLWWLRPWAPRFTLLAAAAYALLYWLDRLLLATSDYLRQSTPFAAGITLVSLAAVWIALTRPRARQAFGLGESNDSGPQD